jgi:cell division protein FtsN
MGHIKAFINKVTHAEDTTSPTVKKKSRRGSYLKIGAIVVSCLILLSGILWQMGIMDPLKYLSKEKPITKPGRLPEAADKDIQKQIEAPPSSVTVAKQGPPEQSAIHDDKVMDTDAPTVKDQAVHDTEVMDMKPDHQMEEGIADEDIVTPSYSEGTFPYSIYLGSFSTQEKAEKAIFNYTTEMLSPFSVKVDLGDKGIWYRVYSGCFREYKEAEEFIKEHNLPNASIKITTYANLIKDYEEPGDKTEIEESLKIKGFSPYKINDSKGNSYLFVGAFITMEGAKAQNAELSAAGINSRVIKR